MDNNKTLGERRVRTTFNPSDDSNVQHIQERAAELINYLDELPITPEQALKFTNPDELGEYKRLKNLAITAIEEGAMWAVKAATT